MDNYAPPRQILLIEDNPQFFKPLQTLFKELDEISFSIQLIKNQNELEVFWNTDTLVEETNRPDLILLSLDFLNSEGLSTLEKIKSNPVLRCSPVIGMVEKDDAPKANQAYQSHINALIHKSQDKEELRKAFENIIKFWLSVVIPSPDKKNY